MQVILNSGKISFHQKDADIQPISPTVPFAMNQSLDELGISRLSNDERLELIGAIWDSITDSAEQTPIPDWHVRILQQRIASADQNPENYVRWEDFIQSLKLS